MQSPKQSHTCSQIYAKCSNENRGKDTQSIIRPVQASSTKALSVVTTEFPIAATRIAGAMSRWDSFDQVRGLPVRRSSILVIQPHHGQAFGNYLFGDTIHRRGKMCRELKRENRCICHGRATVSTIRKGLSGCPLTNNSHTLHTIHSQARINHASELSW